MLVNGKPVEPGEREVDGSHVNYQKRSSSGGQGSCSYSSVHVTSSGDEPTNIQVQQVREFTQLKRIMERIFYIGHTHDRAAASKMNEHSLLLMNSLLHGVTGIPVAITHVIGCCASALRTYTNLQRSDSAQEHTPLPLSMLWRVCVPQLVAGRALFSG